MKKISAGSPTRLAATAAALLLAASVAPFLAQAQSKYVNDTFMLVSHGNGGIARMHVEGHGDHCWATTSSDDGSGGVGISIGDSQCRLWDESTDDAATMHATLRPDKISFRLGGKSYSVSDSATVKRARSLFEPLVSLEEQQSVLGEKQRGLGEKQRDLGAQQRDVKVPIPDMSADFEKVEADAKRLSTEGGTQSDLGDLQSELGDLQSRLGDLQSQAGDAQSQLGDAQSKLGDAQSKLGDEQSTLGDQSQKIAMEIATKLRTVLSQSVQNGTAKSP